MVIAGTRKSEGSQNQLKNPSITVICVDPRASNSLIIETKLTPITTRKNMITMYPRTDAKYAFNSRRNKAGTFFIAASSPAAHAALLPPRPLHE
jgi:hypothetical protein